MKLLFYITPILIALASFFLFRHDFADLATTTLALVKHHFQTITDSTSNFTSTSQNLNAQNQQQTKDNSQSSSIPVHLAEPTEHLFADEMTALRSIRKVFLAVEQAEGQGARVRRSIGTPNLRNFSPFLMMDHFSIKPGAGFPDHPHRGQETITYLMEGGVDHEDFAGNKGTLNSGDLQFMTAGRGIVHAEMPRQNPDGSANVGLQLWVDLPAKLKSCEPRYRDLRAEEIPFVKVDGDKALIKVISGQSHGIDSVKDLAYTPVWILDMELQPGAKVTQPLPETWNAFSYVLDGEVYYGKGESRQKVDQYNIVVFEQQGEAVHVEVDANATKPARIAIIAGLPLDQPIVQYGPFVLTTKEEVYQALFDYQSHTNGFERAKEWKSEIGKSMR